MKKILIFGGSGFIGTYVVEELVRRGYFVIVADIKPCQLNVPTVEYIQCDITSREQVNKAIQRDIDYVYNFAGFSNLNNATLHPVEVVELNIISNLYILDAAKNNKSIQRYIYGSSAYALNDKGSFYGISKLTSEKLIEEYNKQYSVNYTILRYGSVYSERDYDNNYIYSLVKQIIENHKVIHPGDGNELREYIHASDVAKMSVDVIENNEYVNQHLILTGLERMTRNELFEMIKEVLGEDFEVELKINGYTNHYKYSPYSFQAIMSRKMVAHSYVDMGQGILECIKAVYSKVHKE